MSPVALRRRPASGSRRHALWSGVPAGEWNCWKWQMRHALRGVEDLEAIVCLTAAEREGIAETAEIFRTSITPYLAGLIDPEDPSCPIRRQMIPIADENRPDPMEMRDPLAEDGNMVVPGLVHRYPDRVLFLPIDVCAVYCRYCTRKRLVSTGELEISPAHREAAYRYIESHPEVRDVLISGGDPLLLPDSRLEEMILRLRRIPHVEFVRIGTRIPGVLPQRITHDFARMLKRVGPVWMSVHFNHPREITPEVAEACRRMAFAGVPMGGQTVLLRGINDSPDVMKRLMHELLKIRVRPYYIYHCDPVTGTSHLRTSVETGLRIIESLRGHTTGYAVPTYVIDAPGGGGKIPIAPDYVVARENGRLILRNYDGRTYEHRDPSSAPDH